MARVSTVLGIVAVISHFQLSRVNGTSRSSLYLGSSSLYQQGRFTPRSLNGKRLALRTHKGAAWFLAGYGSARANAASGLQDRTGRNHDVVPNYRAFENPGLGPNGRIARDDGAFDDGACFNFHAVP